MIALGTTTSSAPSEITTGTLEAASRATSGLADLVVQAALPILQEAVRAELAAELAKRDAQLEVLFDLLDEQKRRHAAEIGVRDGQIQMLFEIVDEQAERAGRLRAFVESELTKRDVRMDAHLDMLGLNRKAVTTATGRFDLVDQALRGLEDRVKGCEQAAFTHSGLLVETSRGMLGLSEIMRQLRETDASQDKALTFLAARVETLAEDFGDLEDTEGHQYSVLSRLTQRIETLDHQFAELHQYDARHDAELSRAGVRLEHIEQLTNDLARLQADGSRLILGAMQAIRLLGEAEDRQDAALTEVESRVGDLEAGPAPSEPPPPQLGIFDIDRRRLDAISHEAMILAEHPAPAWLDAMVKWPAIGVDPAAPTEDFGTWSIKVIESSLMPDDAILLVSPAAEPSEVGGHFSWDYYKTRSPILITTPCCPHPGTCCICQGAKHCQFEETAEKIEPKIVDFEGNGKITRWYV